MSLVDARLRVHHPCPYCDISAEFPETLLLLWCDNRRDVFLVASPSPSELDRTLDALRLSFRAAPLLQEGCEAVVAVPDFEWTSPPSVTSIARRSGVWVLHPVVYHGGTETYRLLADARATLGTFVARVRALGDVEVLSVSGRSDLATVREGPTASVHFFEGLTDRQARCLVAAYEGGLLDVPARSRWDDVARREGLSRSTFGEHLRKGQLRLLANSYAALKARTTTQETPVVLRATRRPRGPRRTPQLGVRAVPDR